MTLRNGLIKSEVGSSIMLYDLKGEIFYAFNETASMVIDLMGFNVPISQIKKTISAYFNNVSIDELDKNIDDFILKLKSLDFIEETSIVNNDYVQCQITNQSKYLKPDYKEYTKEWLLENHPGTFYNLSFSDRWGPGSGTISG